MTAQNENHCRRSAKLKQRRREILRCAQNDGTKRKSLRSHCKTKTAAVAVQNQNNGKRAPDI
jgi:hypothetical protein